MKRCLWFIFWGSLFVALCASCVTVVPSAEYKMKIIVLCAVCVLVGSVIGLTLIRLMK
jgi:hypothetical protein